VKKAAFTLLLGLAGYFCHRSWITEHDAIAARHPLRINRAQAIETAQRLAAANGLDTAAWRFGVSLDERERTAAVRESGDSEIARSFPALSVEVGGYHAKSQSSIRVSLTPEGRVLSWRLHDGQSRQRREDTDHPAAAEAQFREMVGETADRYQKTIAGARSQDGFRTTWEAPDGQRPGVLARFAVVVRAGKVVQAEHDLEIGDMALTPRQRESQQLLLRLLPWATAFYWIVIVLTLWMFFSAFLRRHDHLRMGIAAAILALPLMAVYHLAGGSADSVAMAIADSPSTIGSSRLLLLIGEVTPALLLAVLLASGYATLPASLRPYWVGMKLVSEGRLLSRPVGREVAAGMLFGAVIAALFLLPARLGVGPPSTPAVAALLALELRPFLQTINPSGNWNALIPFAIVVPWCLSRRGAWRWLLIPGLVLSAAAFLGQGSVNRYDWRTTLPVTLSLYLTCLLCFRMWGILATLLAPAAGFTLYLSGLLLAMPAEQLQDTGWSARLVWLGALALGAVLGWRGEDVAEDEVMRRMDPPSASVSRSERQRLQADFSVARRAQQDMLPAKPPVVPGYTLAGSCRPALEVGGDLFDYLRFESGELGLCVADVSGKGVQASLYMTMTKGMLMAALEEPANLTSILSRLNRHLKEWGRKRTFVTMSLALLDPPSGLIRHARAGHNPPVLLRGGKAALLQPPGLGLGMVGPASFDRALKVEEIELAPGECFVLYSDGLTECMNRHLEQFGEERLLRIVEESAGLPAAEVEEAILRAVSGFQGDAEAHDDLTVLVLRREHSSEPALA
jgi:serine phosphatase RsbU (regulator of sigma subunit)